MENLSLRNRKIDHRNYEVDPQMRQFRGNQLILD